ncbi:acyltransferase family protein [Gordonia sp. SID5947]|nr:acyltransferase family protein [Gordonia sp. SID5947]
MVTQDQQTQPPEPPQNPDETDSVATRFATPVEAAPQKPRDKHLYQIDFVRLVTFAAVILDHVLLGIATGTDVGAGALGLLLRYTRYSFFALTGFVLTYQYRDRELKPLTFWRRRYKLIGLPFVVWSLFYWVYGHYRAGGMTGLGDLVDSPDSVATSLKSIGYDLVTGNAWYHLYFLSVSMQIYAVFPLVLIVLRKTWGYHRYLLLVSFAAQATLMYMMVRPPLDFFTHGPQQTLWTHLVATILPYQFFVFAGCVAAMHYPAFQRFMIRWRLPLIAGAFVVIAITLLYYLHETNIGETIFRATNVFMLHNTFAYIAIIIILYCLGTVWQDRRTKGSIPDNFMRTAADRSFGIYLAHALALSELMPIIAEHRDLPTWPLILVAYVGTVAVTIFIVEVLRRSPISLITTGRSTIDWRTQNAGRSIAVATVAIALGVLLRVVFTALVGDLIVATGALLLASACLVFWRQRRAATAAL